MTKEFPSCNLDWVPGMLGIRYMFHNVEDTRNPKQTKKEHLNRWVTALFFLSGEKEGEKGKKRPPNITPSSLSLQAMVTSMLAHKEHRTSTMGDGICLPIPYPKIKYATRKD